MPDLIVLAALLNEEGRFPPPNWFDWALLLSSGLMLMTSMLGGIWVVQRAHAWYGKALGIALLVLCVPLLLATIVLIFVMSQSY